MGEVRNAYIILIVKLEGKRPLGRPRRRWEDNVRIYLKEIVAKMWTGFICSEPSGFVKGGESLD
jgi:hypothetical protein